MHYKHRVIEALYETTLTTLTVLSGFVVHRLPPLHHSAPSVLCFVAQELILPPPPPLFNSGSHEYSEIKSIVNEEPMFLMCLLWSINMNSLLFFCVE